MLTWLTLRPRGRRASSYRFVMTRFSNRTRTAIQERAMRSIGSSDLFTVASPLLPYRLYCIYNFRRVKSKERKINGLQRNPGRPHSPRRGPQEGYHREEVVRLLVFPAARQRVRGR